MDTVTVPTTPPIPRQTHQQARRKNIAAASSLPPASRGVSSSHGGPVSPASPEVISSLITSLAVISKPANSHFDGPFDALNTSPASVPRSPLGGSFGVDYGAFSKSTDADAANDNTPLDELAAAPPVIRTAKPPSGFSPLTAPKSPNRETQSSGAIKSMLSSRSASRPTSKDSYGSRDADAQSIGNLSIERGAVSPIPELRRRSSHDSWGKKTGRSHKGLMYMSSKERLREKEADKKRSSIGGGGGGSERLSTSGTVSTRADPFLAETPISEESHTDSPSTKEPRHSLDNGAPSPRPIPARDSSLHKTGPNANTKRSSRRSSKQKADLVNNDTIHELDEQLSNRFGDNQERPEPTRKSTQDTRQQHRDSSKQQQTKDDLVIRNRNSDEVKMTSTRLQKSNHAQRPAPRSFSLTRSGTNQRDEREATPEDDAEDGAPFPAVAQGRRRDHSYDGRRRSGRHTPDPADASVKRSGSKLKRLSGPLSPRADDRLNVAAADGGRSGRPSVDDTQVIYERPQSADSVDDAVEAYLCSPRLSQKIRHPQTGRIISFSEVGDSEGSAVFCCVGMGLTRYIMAFYDELALTLKLRLITPDRPGVGDSEPYADGTATPLSWPDDVYAICQALKITKFSILAHSAGAIYALATALRMPQHIRGRIHLLAPWIPPSQMSVFGTSAQTPLPPSNAIPTSQRILRALPTPLLKAANSSFMSATSSSITSSLPKTPKRKRKSNANLAKEREKDAHKDHPLPTDNKENLLLKRSAGDATTGSSSPPKEFVSMEEMDRVRPRGTTSSSTAAAAVATSHKKSSSGTSVSNAHALREAREAAVLAAAADALADRERQATYDTRLTHAIWELATTGANPAVDLLVCLERRHTIGFRYVDITRPVIIHHGSRDTRVPVENVRWLGKTMRRCEVRVLEGETHGLMASATVMGGVLMEIAKEWEDWGRLTGASSRGRDSIREERGRRGTIGLAR
ncbi:alpha beta hydrolase fold family [Niveomyces insectorum RCEF 264]|uniref:Alpha beta hydrolase fold family n=1 Tax=Niveomyces insectorum RCEF 264 TaxID=1081102 RepID=A0A167Y0P4_9HYPO|nr:alpha beta hydrolase fold family [Niveomyces insectorum RCEF 264]